MTRVQSIIKGISNLKPMPHVATKIMALADDPESSMAQIVDLISHDAVITANVLKAANCAYYGRTRRFDSIHQATVFMGMDDIVDLTLLTSSAENLNRSQKGYGLNNGELWRCSVTSALLARTLASDNGLCDIHLAFTGALLKDIGKVVLSQYVNNRIEQINSLVKNDGRSFSEAEKKVLGIDHAEVGAMVAKVWRFSPKMVDIISHHHDPSNAKVAAKETGIVHLSDVLCMMMGISGGFDALTYRFHRPTIEEMGMSDTDFQNTIAGCLEELKRAEDLMA